MAPKRWMQTAVNDRKVIPRAYTFFQFKLYMRGQHVNRELRYIEPPFFHCDEGGQLTPKNQ